MCLDWRSQFWWVIGSSFQCLQCVRHTGNALWVYLDPTLQHPLSPACLILSTGRCLCSAHQVWCNNPPVNHQCSNLLATHDCCPVSYTVRCLYSTFEAWYDGHPGGFSLGHTDHRKGDEAKDEHQEKLLKAGQKREKDQVGVHSLLAFISDHQILAGMTGVCDRS